MRKTGPELRTGRYNQQPKTEPEGPSHILVVEDEEAHADLIQRGFEDHKDAFRISFATSLAGARKIINNDPPALAFVDWLLPDGKGAELLSVRTSGIALPVIVMTSHGSEELAVEVIKAGALDYLVKSDIVFAEIAHTAERAIRECTLIRTRQRLEEEIIKSELWFRSIIQNASDIIRVIDKNGIIVYDSPSSERILGYPEDYTIGKTPFEFIHPGDVDLVRADFQEILSRTNPGTPTEFRILKADGTYTYVESVGINLLEVEGVNGIVVTTRVVDERKRMELALRESERMQNDIISFLPDATFVIDKAGTIIAWNRAMESMTGRKSEEMLGKGDHVYAEPFYGKPRPILIDLVLNTDQTFISEHYRGVRQNGDMITAETTLPLLRGEERRILWGIALPLKNVKGEITGAIESIRDVTLIRQAESQLRESEEKFRTLAEFTPLAIMIYQGDYWVYSNPAGERLSGYSCEELYTMHYWEFVAPEFRHLIRDRGKRRMDGEHLPLSCDFKILAKDGTEKWASLTGSLIQFRGRPAGLISVVDISDRKKAGDALYALTNELEQRVLKRTSELELEIEQRKSAEAIITASLHEKEILLREIHHRVKNNLQIIASLLNLQSRYVKDEATLISIRESQNRVKAMALVHEKLYQSTNLSKIDFDDYVRYLGKNLLSFFDMKGKGITFTTEIRDISLDINTAIPLGLIINELISNSLKHAFPKGKTGKISIAVSRNNHILSIVMKDNGSGIAEGFDWKNATSLGLRLVISLVEQLQGSIELDRHAGTTFTIVVQEKT
jgi:PAS domain S-box-containing protein